MKKLIFTCAHLLIISLQLNAQWFWQNPLPQGNTLKAVDFVDASIGWAVGEYGTIIRTSDGGVTWTLQTSGSTNHLYGVCFTDENIGTVVGFNYYSLGNTILRTTDGSISWSSQISGTNNHLYNVFFTDENTGWAVCSNGIIFHTTNGSAMFIEVIH